MINIAIVEDENPQASLLENFLERYAKEKGILLSTTRFGTATAFLEAHNAAFDLVFMDILLPGLNGMEASKKLRENNKTIVIVFVTNLANFAVKGYEVDALDFIIKPIEYDFFQMKMDKAVRTVSERVGEKVLLPPKKPQLVLFSNEIIYVEVKDHELIFHTHGGPHSFRGSLKDAEAALPKRHFVRCSNSFLVNLQYVSKVEGDDVTLGKDVVRLSRKRKKDFILQLANYLGEGK